MPKYTATLLIEATASAIESGAIALWTPDDIEQLRRTARNLNNSFVVADAQNEIVRELAKMDPETFDKYEDATCYFCDQGYARPDRGKAKHSNDCLWVRARKLKGETDE